MRSIVIHRQTYHRNTVVGFANRFLQVDRASCPGRFCTMKAFFTTLAILVGLLAPALALPSGVMGEKDFGGSDAAMFRDVFFTELRPGATAARVAAMSNPVLRDVATALMAKEFDVAARRRAYEAYEPVEILAKRLKTGAYSQFENPTGIYFNTGDQAVLNVSGLGKNAAKLRVANFGREGSDQSYPLRDGLNVIPLKNSGLAYLSYYVPDFEKAPKLEISVLTGKVNGVFNAVTSTNDDWKKLLAGAVSEMIDIVGKQVQLIYPVEELRKACPDRGRELVALYDGIIRDQHEIMGLVKYKRVPKNHILGRGIWKGYMHADGIGAAFIDSAMPNIANPDKIPANGWGIAHEFGHVDQTRPGMRWVSTTEVTNNIYSAVSNYRLNPTDMRIEHEKINGGDGNVIGGRFNAYLNSALVAKEQWLCQRGPDKMEGYENGGDHFVKLAPLWQLQLFFAIAGHGNADFYADIFEKVRNTDESHLSNGELQLNFMRNTCDALKLDLTSFFTLVGMLKPIDKDMDDYTRAQLTITQTQCDDLVRYATRYKKPDSPVIFYISANSVDAYKNRASIQGRADQGISGDGTTRTIDHAVWKNVAAYETYRGAELVKIAMSGTGSPNNSTTLVQYPVGSTRIEAVSWDGKRTLVTGAR